MWEERARLMRERGITVGHPVGKPRKKPVVRDVHIRSDHTRLEQVVPLLPSEMRAELIAARGERKENGNVTVGKMALLHQRGSGTAVLFHTHHSLPTRWYVRFHPNDMCSRGFSVVRASSLAWEFYPSQGKRIALETCAEIDDAARRHGIRVVLAHETLDETWTQAWRSEARFSTVQEFHYGALRFLGKSFTMMDTQVHRGEYRWYF